MMKKHLDLFFAKRTGLTHADAFPRLSKQGEVRWDADRLNAYRTICGLPSPKQGTLPLLVPQIAAAKLHLDLFADRRFPFGALGIVHIENHVTVHEPIDAEATLEIATAVENCRAWTRANGSAPQGWLFDLTTDVSVAGVVHGRWVATILARSKTSAAARSAEPGPRTPKKDEAAQEPGLLLRSAMVAAPEDIGRRYGAIASDRNPIHQHALLAKAFGFKRAIAHGLWSLARTLGEADDDLPTREFTVHTRFKKPIFLPGRFLVEVRRDAEELRLKASSRGKSGDVPHLAITVAPRG